MNEHLITQTRNAFAYVQQLYKEVSLLIHEIEIHFHKTNEAFIISQPSGYGVVAATSRSLDSANTESWPILKFSIFFVPKLKTEERSGLTITPLSERVLYMRFLLDDYESTLIENQPLTQPAVLFGVFEQVERKHKTRFEKFEQLLNYLETGDDRIFNHLPNILYEDANIKLAGTFKQVPLFSLCNSQTIHEELVAPALELFRGIAIARST